MTNTPTPPKARPKAADRLISAANIMAEREKQYGDASDSFATIGAYWSAYLGQTITRKDVAALMLLLKIARAGRSDAPTAQQEDDLLDAINYAAFGAHFTNTQEDDR